MGHTIKGQSPRLYRPSVTRRASGLSPINELSNAQKRWARLRQAVKRSSQMQRNIRTKGFAKRGRFTVTRSPPKKKSPPRVSLWKNAAPGIYFVSSPYTRGRFTVENIRGFVPLKQSNILPTSALRR